MATKKKKKKKKTTTKAATTKQKAAKKAPKKAAKTTTKKAAKKAPRKAAKTTTKKKAAKKAPKKAAKKATKKAAKKATKKAAKKATKKATKKAAKKATSSEADVVALPAKRLPQEPIALPAQRLAAPSREAAVTLVPDDEVDDALDEAVGAAFDSVFLPVSTPPTRAPAAPFEPGDPAEDLAQACAALALEKKAEDVVVLRVAELTSYADFFVIAQAPSDRQVQAIARNVTEELKKRGKTPMSTDGLEQGNWVIVDYGSVVLHVFLTSARSYYDLDGFWVDAPRLAVDEARGHGALAAMA